MAGPWSSNELEFASQVEASYATSPGALVGADFFRMNAEFPFGRNVARLDRDKDSGTHASVLGTQKGRENGTFKLSGNIIPSGNAVTPTLPDIHDLLRCHFGSFHLCTAHTTLVAGSTTTVLNFAVGGVAASGVQVGDLIMVDVDATNGMEVRPITVVAGDVVTVSPPLSAAPAAAQAVKVGVTYSFLYSALLGAHLWQYLDGDNFRHKMGGCAISDMGIKIDASSRTPVATIEFSGEGEKIQTQTTARPTPVYSSADPIIPSAGKAYIGASGKLCVLGAAISSNNAMELRQNESCSLFPSGIRRSGNGGRYNITQELEMLLVSGTVEGYFDNASGLTAYNAIVQLGVLPGQTVAWWTPKWIIDSELGESEIEVSEMNKGRAYALTTHDTELKLAFI